MKVSELKQGDIIWLYNSYEEYFIALEFTKVNEDGSSRFHITGETSIDEPENWYTIDSREFRNTKLPDGNMGIEVISTKGISYKLRRIKECFMKFFL
jgi:hypothetical protein